MCRCDLRARGVIIAGVQRCDCQGGNRDCPECAGTNRKLFTTSFGNADHSAHVPCPTHEPDRYRQWVARGAPTAP